MNNPLRISNLKIKISKLKSPLIIVLVVLTTFTVASNSTAASGIAKNSIIGLTNKNRQLNNLPVLLENTKLDSAARSKAKDMLNANYFDHYSPNGKTPWDFIIAQNYDYSFAGENLAMDFDTPEGVTRAWLNSPTHAKNILNPLFAEIGVAVVDGKINGAETTLVIQMFGAQRSSVLSSILNMPVVETVSKILGINS